jgi:tetratricopeptide (TPR) repeat protein
MSQKHSHAVLEPPDSFCLSAAVGWMELGNLKEAQYELAQVRKALQSHPDVLQLRWEIAARLGTWDQALETARKLMAVAPDHPSGWLHQAYALRRLPGGGLNSAWEALLPAAELFRKESIIPFNLACYACQLGNHDLARIWLKRAMRIGGKQEIQRLALADSDLEPLWPEIGSL